MLDTFRERKLTQQGQLLILLILLFLAGLLFFPVIHGYWLADDFSWVRDLLHYDWRTIPKLFLGVWPREGEYRPLWSASFIMDLQIWGPNAGGLHLTNLFFHIIVSVLVWYLVKIISQNNNLAAFLALAFFVFHPIHVEPVAWISARGHVLVTIFILSSIIFLRRFQIYGGTGNYIAYLGSAVAAFTTQEAAAALPFLLLLQALVYIPRLNQQQFVQILKLHLPIWGLFALYIVLRLVLFGRLSDRMVSTIQQLLTFIYIPNRILWLSPSTITDVPHVLAGVGMTWLLFLSIAILILLPFTFLQSLELKNYTREFIYFAVGWPIITTLVYLGVNSQRHLYLASIGPCVIMGLAVAHLITAKGLFTMYGVIVATFLLFIYGWALIAGISGFALNGERSLQIQHEVDRAIERASWNPNAVVIVIPEIPNNHEVLWDYFYPDALQPPFTNKSPAITVIPSFASCHCRPEEWMSEQRASLTYLVHDVTGPVYVVEWDTHSTLFVTHLFSPADFRKAGYLASNGSFLRSSKPGEAIILP